MRVSILERAKSFKSSFLYNEKKVLEGKADICGCANIERSDLWTARRTMERYEDNPRISSRIKNLGFHMAVSPSEEEMPKNDMQELDMIMFIYDMMEELGYGEQPYVIFRHNDIERQHYHVVSVNVRKDGTLINDKFIGLRVRDIAKNKGFKVALTREEKISRKETVKHKIASPPLEKRNGYKFDPSEIKSESFSTAFKEALTYDFRTFDEFRSVMFSMGVKAERVERIKEPGQYNLLMKGMDSLRRNATLFLSAENDLGFPGYRLMSERMAENDAAGVPDRRYEDVRAEVIAEWCKKASSSADEFSKMLRECGLEAHFLRDEDMLIQGVNICDPQARRVFGCQSLSPVLSVASFRKEEESKHWRKPRKRGMEKGEVRVSAEQKEEIRDLILARCAKEGVEVPEKILNRGNAAGTGVKIK